MADHNREEREALIEKAAKAMYFEDTGVDIEFAEWMEIERVEAHARAALAVFEQAHAPTGDDAEALANVLLDGREAEDGLTALRERILAAGFRRTAQDEPTDAEVEAFKREWWAAKDEGDDGNKVRRGLRAAAAVREEKP